MDAFFGYWPYIIWNTILIALTKSLKFVYVKYEPISVILILVNYTDSDTNLKTDSSSKLDLNLKPDA
ncbi:hypothetical protein H8356DRAFT_1432892 [Neocallimastix lanati (nom. inval.)]|nr:hypothetical protein H8356DRAFT_1432892 [Neocallimastix sp. JGI-2020a]